MHGHNDPSNHEIEGRLAALEQTTRDLNNRIFDNHQKFVTVLFSVVAVIMSVLLSLFAYWSRLDVKNSTAEMEKWVEQDTRDMDAKVNSAVADMQKNFQELAGESLKKPVLTIVNGNGLLDGQSFKTQNGQVLLFPLFIKNEGDKKSGTFSVRLLATADLGLRNGECWQPEYSNDKGFPFEYSYNSPRGTSAPEISPKDTFELISDVGIQVNYFVNSKITCKLDVFYDADIPAEAKFTITQ